ncbi:MAG: trypsin-like peptidase domain-containing protein [Oscillospiraceae bacterium]|nr:trypsin-like peptidase domain-containing protein [Oscillospiraceae bacterium]
MEPFENEKKFYPQEQPQEPEQSEPPQVSSYHGAGAGRKESPYANSPYMMPDPEPEPEYRRPSYAQRHAEIKSRPRKLKKWHKVTLGIFGAAVLVLGTFFATNAWWEKASRQMVEDVLEVYDQRFSDMQAQMDNLPSGSSIGLPASGEAMTPAQLYASSVDSVVAIATKVQTNSYYGPSEATSAGSGFILSEDGYVITNYHVVEGATSIEVITHDGTEYPATLVGHDSTNDLAVLDVEAEGLPAALLGSSNDLVIGDMVVAIGNPLGELASTQTVGYVSGIDREVSTDGLTTINMIQTDAAINPGNSGGPLFNMNGEVIGITTAKYSGTTGSGATIEGIGFAIPIDDVEPLIDDLIDFGYVTGAYMGVTVQNVDAEAAAQFGLPTGAYIVTVDKDGAADRAGIQPKDIVIGLDEHEVSNVTDLTRALRNYKAGDTATVKLIRSGREMNLVIVLDEKPQQPAATETQPQQEQQQPQRDIYDDLFDDFLRRFFGN